MQVDSQARAHLISCDNLHDGTRVRLRVAIPTPQVQGKVGSLWEDMSLAARRFGELDDELGVAKRLKLDPTGQRERVSERLMSARRAATTAQTNAAHALKVAADRRRAVYAPPPLDKADFVAAQRDSEIRQRYASMAAKERDALHAQMRDGKNDDALHALLRDPLLAGPQSAIVKSVWEPRVQRERAAELQAIDDQEEEATATAGGSDALLRALEQFQVGTPRPPRPTEDVTYGASA